MLDRIIIGRYVPTRSVIHQLDARSKLLFIFFYVFIVFLANNPLTYGTLVVVAVAITTLTGVPMRYIRQGLRPLLFIIIFTLALHLFFTREGEIVFQLGFIKIYSVGIQQGIYISLRFFVLILVTTLLTLTTTPIEITDGLERLLKPFKRVGLPVHELALMISIALRFIPTLLQETDKIMKAQSSRGAKFYKGTMKERLHAIVSLLVPLFISSFRRAEELAMAMEARGYNGGEGRTSIRRVIWKRNDTLTIVFLVILTTTLFILRS